jgi:Cft2 family RNA processing exonuclease
MAKLTFLGAAGTVTGSKYLVEAAGKKLLLDCGIFQGSPELSARNFKPLTAEPKTIDYCVLTHAHLDHAGWLPCLVRDGYQGPIYANPATMELATISLKDSAHLQEEDAERAQRNAKHSDAADRDPLYTSADIDPMLRLLKPMPRRGGFDVSPEFHFDAYDAGHILGSTSLALTITENGKKTIVVFSGDIGRYGEVILNDPTTPPKADILLCESTRCEARRFHRHSRIRDWAHANLHVLPAATGRRKENSHRAGLCGQPDGAECDGSLCEVQGRPRRGFCAPGIERYARSAGRARISSDPFGRRFESHQ